MPYYMFAFSLDPMALNQRFKGQMPLHCTLMHWFRVRRTPSELLYRLGRVFAECHEVSFDTVKPASFGLRNTIPVYLITKTPAIDHLHMRLYLALDALKVDYREPAKVGYRYRPYIKIIQARPGLGWTFKSDCVHLVVRERVNGAYFKRVCGVFYLSKTPRVDTYAY